MTRLVIELEEDIPIVEAESILSYLEDYINRSYLEYNLYDSRIEEA